MVAYALGLALIVAFAIRWARHADASLADLRHPVLGAMHGTLPGGLLVMAVMTSVVGTSYLPDQLVVGIVAVLAVVGIVIALVLSVAFSITLFTGATAAETVNGGWLIPPVVTIIIPLVLVPLMPHVSAGNARLLLALGYATLGMGFLLYLFVMGLLHDRLVLHPMPPAALAPSLWIGLGPIGVAVLAVLALARAGHSLFGPTATTVSMISLLVATALWGFGLWWYAAAATLLVRYLRAGRLPFHLGWWGFTFPLGAFTVATLTIARAWEAPVIEAVGVLLFASLIAFWSVVAARTVRATASGEVWMR
ncbi:putative membrane proteinc [mine drainage metagenome]|uniref:Putative membrane proteinc n=1 Tax=mine drainage metagenome TaxID=410659 RepID=A0A1J5Q6Y6_9ZZZZ